MSENVEMIYAYEYGEIAHLIDDEYCLMSFGKFEISNLGNYSKVIKSFESVLIADFNIEHEVLDSYPFLFLLNIEEFNTQVLNRKINNIRFDGSYFIIDKVKYKIGRFIEKFKSVVENYLKLDINTESCVNLAKAKFLDSDLTFEIINDFDFAYNTKNYIGETYILGSSCMNNKFSQLQFYKNNSCARVLILHKDMKIYGRAIVWVNGDDLHMDEVYSISDHITSKFHQYAKSNGVKPVENLIINDIDISCINITLDSFKIVGNTLVAYN